MIYVECPLLFKKNNTCCFSLIIFFNFGISWLEINFPLSAGAFTKSTISILGNEILKSIKQGTNPEEKFRTLYDHTDEKSAATEHIHKIYYKINESEENAGTDIRLLLKNWRWLEVFEYAGIEDLQRITKAIEG